MNDHQQVKQLVSDLKLNKQALLVIESASNSRRYLSTLAVKAKKKYITKDVDGKLLVIRIK